MKFFSKLFLLSALSIGSFSLFAEQLNRKQASKYIGHVIDTLLVPTMHEGRYKDELQKWVDDCKEQVLSNEQLYKRDKNDGRVYSSDKIYDKLLDKIVALIEKQSFDYAQKELSKDDNLNEERIEQLSEKIAFNMGDKIYNIIDSSSNLESGAFKDYVGAPLLSKVRSMIQKELAKESGTRKTKRDRVHKDQTKHVKKHQSSRHEVRTYKVVPVVQPVYVPTYRVAYAAPRVVYSAPTVVCAAPVIRPSFGFSFCL